MGIKIETGKFKIGDVVVVVASKGHDVTTEPGYLRMCRDGELNGNKGVITGVGKIRPKWGETAKDRPYFVTYADGSKDIYHQEELARA